MTPTRQHRLYATFFSPAGKPCWRLHRNGRMARRFARAVDGLCLSMPLPYGSGAWDAPTFRACADRTDADYRPLSIRFEGADPVALDAYTDRAIERARRFAERGIGHALPVDPRTGFPSFAVYRGDNELGGG